MEKENNVQEIWRDVKDYEGYYMVSNLGRVKSLNYRHTGREGILSPLKDKQDYSVVNLCKDGTNKQKKVHRLVFEAFCGRIPEKMQIDHIVPIRNGGTNELSNLRVCTPKENNNNPLTLKNYSKAKKGENNPFYNKHRTLETRQKISDAKQGTHHTIEARQKISKANKGKFGRNGKSVIQLTKEDKFVKRWDSMMDIQRTLGYAHTNISACCNGKLPHAYDFRWQFESDYIKMLHNNRPVQLMLQFEEAV